MRRFCAIGVGILLCAGLAAGSARAGIIGPTENGDLSAGDASQWTIEENGTTNNPVYAYMDIGGTQGGVLHSGNASANYNFTAYNNNLADIGNSGSIRFMINSFPGGGGGSFGFGFLGSPTYSGGGIGTTNNNEYNRGYFVNFSYSWGTFSIRLGRKRGGWNQTQVGLTNTSIPWANVNDAAWHTLTVNDAGDGNIQILLDATEIFNEDDGANYLPTLYPTDYAGGGLWGVYYDTTSIDMYVDDLQVGTPVSVPEPATLALLAVGGLALSGRPIRRRRVAAGAATGEAKRLRTP